MKYVVLLCDGMADTPVPELAGRTPMEAAHKPHMDTLAAKSEVGVMRTVPDGLPAGSDVANLSVIGYDPAQCYTGRSPLEAANIGIELSDDDVALRCNLVTLSNEPDYAAKTMVDYCAGDIHTAQADQLVQALQAAFGGGEFDFYTGTAYRHCLVWHGGKTALGKITPPHDISGQVVGPYLPAHPDAAPLLSLMERSVELLRDHSVNRERITKGLRPATSIWLWGQGKRPQLGDFFEIYGLRGAMISAVDLLKGIGRIAHMTVCDVPGATGYIDTNFEGKRDAALAALRNGCDYAYIHVEAPDECGHRGEVHNKVKAIEEIDRRILGPLLEELGKLGDYTLLIAPDHPTPLQIRTHSPKPVPYLLYRSDRPQESGVSCFSEDSARKTGLCVPQAHTMLSRMLQNT